MATNKLKFGTETPTKLYLGATEVTKAYMGETLVYEKSSSSGYTVTIIEENVAATYTVYINGVGVPRNSSNIQVFHNVKTFNIECPVTGNRIYNATGSLTNVSWNSGFAYSKDIDITEDSSASLDTDQ